MQCSPYIRYYAIRRSLAVMVAMAVMAAMATSVVSPLTGATVATAVVGSPACRHTPLVRVIRIANEIAYPIACDWQSGCHIYVANGMRLSSQWLSWSASPSRLTRLCVHSIWCIDNLIGERPAIVSVCVHRWPHRLSTGKYSLNLFSSVLLWAPLSLCVSRRQTRATHLSKLAKSQLVVTLSQTNIKWRFDRIHTSPAPTTLWLPLLSSRLSFGQMIALLLHFCIWHQRNQSVDWLDISCADITANATTNTTSDAIRQSMKGCAQTRLGWLGSQTRNDCHWLVYWSVLSGRDGYRTGNKAHRTLMHPKVAINFKDTGRQWVLRNKSTMFVNSLLGGVVVSGELANVSAVSSIRRRL